MTDQNFLHTLGLIVIAAAVFAVVASRLKLPTIVAYLAAGLALGPLTGIVPDSDAVHTIAESGIVLLLFLVGLELNIDRIRAVGKTAVIAGLGQIFATASLAIGAGKLIGLETTPALVLAVGLTLSSTVVVVKLLVERRSSSSVAGQTAIGILLVQDLFVIVLLTVVAGLGSPDDTTASPSVLSGIARALGMMAAALVAIVLASKFILPPVFAWARRSRETVFIASIAWCFIVVAAVHALHLSPEIGAFLAGVSLAQLPHAHDLQRRITPLMNGFVAVFFVSLGIGMTFGTGALFWLKAVALAGFVIVGKFTIVMAITHRLGYSRRQAFDSSLLLIQISEFSFIFAATATAAGLAGSEVGALLAVVGLLTIPVSAISVRFSDNLFATVNHRRLLRMFGSPGAACPQEPATALLGGHVIVVGMNTLGRKLALALHEKGTTVLAIDTDPRKLSGLPCITVEGDAASPAVLAETSLPAARLLVSTLHITETNEFLAYRARHAGVPSAVHAPDLKDVATLLDLDVAYLMTPKTDSLREQRRVLASLGYLEGTHAMTGLAILLATAAVGFAIAQWLRLPVIPLLIALGVALGQLGPEVGDTAVSQTLEIGLAFLVFFAGLSLSPAHFKGQSRAVFWVGSTQFIAVSTLGFFAALTLGFETVTALYLGAALATSSTLVVVRQLFRHRGAAGSYRRLVTGVILFQDVSIILVIVLLAHFGAGATATATGTLAFLLVAAVALVLQRTLPALARSRRFHDTDDELVLLGSLSLLILFAYAANAAGLSFAAGAFWAGFALSGFPLTNIVRAVLDSFNTFFLAVFFAALGAQVHFDDTSIFLPALALSAIVFFVTPPLVAAVAEWQGKISTRSAITSGLLLAQTSEFSVIMAVYGQRLGHIDESTVSLIALVAVITMTLTPLIATPAFAHHLFRFHPLRKRYNPPPDLHGHVVILGFGASGRYTIKPFIEHGIPAVVIDHDPANVKRLNDSGTHAIAGDGGDLNILERAAASRARLVFSALPDPDDSVRVILHLKGKTPVLARVFEQADADKITAAGGTPILSSTATTENFLEWFDQFSSPKV